MSVPRVTVVMPVHNGEAFLREAVDSMLAQDYPDFVLLAVDDGSTDSSLEILRSYDDPRVRMAVNETNLNRSRTLNRAIADCASELIGRMDADDIALPGRLSRQVRFLDEHPDVGVCGTWIRTFGGDGTSTWRLPTDPAEVAARLLFLSVIAHPTVLMRRSLLREHDLEYDPAHLYAEDWDLWQRASRVLRLSNVPEVHLEYRVKSVAERAAEPGIAQRDRLRHIELQGIVGSALARLGVDATTEDIDLHLRLGAHDFRGEAALLDEYERWLGVLAAANDAARVYPEPQFKAVLADYWFHACYGNAQIGPQALLRWRRGRFSDWRAVPPVKWAKFGVRVATRRGL
jgi:glycosyltransferase involved in cell wall biosynthesis